MRRSRCCIRRVLTRRRRTRSVHSGRIPGRTRADTWTRSRDGPCSRRRRRWLGAMMRRKEESVWRTRTRTRWIPCRPPTPRSPSCRRRSRRCCRTRHLTAPSPAVSLCNLRPVGGEVAGRVARVHVRGPAVGLPCRRHRFAPITTVSPSIETLLPNWSSAAPSSAVSLATCVQLEARSPAVSRVNTYADPLL